MSAADCYAFALLLALATIAEIARLQQRIADLEDDVTSARQAVEDEQRSHQHTRLYGVSRPTRALPRTTTIHLPEGETA
ncbi:hypothetical protein OHB04_02635 [Streptomyces sp. NBC_01775]|uniref:hypothetical protein n=1 Tax=Streptomyces sp. NBC_01775 TaxID=2975939 RepID=UPI002DD82A11|nr:hypothetical protein [Streptomyces sp. NBC_01775]WSB74790.1 hypothetical protein OHB04_02635 [Streptomyces sp. NBC_01775]